MRALAALAVALNHSLIVLTVSGNKFLCNYPPFSDLNSSGEFAVRILLLFIGNGNLAVTFFFTLSGFVLGISLDRRFYSGGKNTSFLLKNYFYFILKRILRLFPAHVTVLLLIMFFVNFIYTPLRSDVASAWFNFWYRSDITADLFLKNLIFLDHSMNSVTWVLKYHLIGIFFMPFMYFLLRRFSLVTDIALLFLLYYIYIKSGMLAFLYLSIFGIGLLVPNIKYLFDSMSQRFKITASLLLIIYLILPRSSLLPIFPSDVVLHESWHIAIIEAIGCMGAIGLLSYGQQIKIFDILRCRFLQYIGRISYSFFLVHIIALFILTTVLMNVLPKDTILNYPVLLQLLLASCSVALALGIAELIYRHIEQPLIKYSNKLLS